MSETTKCATCNGKGVVMYGGDPIRCRDCATPPLAADHAQAREEIADITADVAEGLIFDRCECGHVGYRHNFGGTPCQISGCSCAEFRRAPAASPREGREPDAWRDAKAVRGKLIEIIGSSPERGALVHAMGGTYQTYGHLVDALLGTPPAAPAVGVTEAQVEHLVALREVVRAIAPRAEADALDAVIAALRGTEG